MPSEARLVVRARVNGQGSGKPRLDVDLALGAGITAVMGPSGAGKSTLLSTVAGLVTPAWGSLKLDGRPLFDSERRLCVPPHARRVAIVFQSLALFPHLNAWQNVAYGSRERSRAARRKSALEWLARARVPHVAERFPESLSGGEAQRVALARALASEPRALLLDEPFSALDPQLRSELGADLVALVAELDIPALLVTHQRDDALRASARLVELNQGRVVRTEELQRREVPR